MTDITEPAGLDIGRVIQETFAVLSRHFVTFVILGLILVGVPAVLLGGVQVSMVRAAFGGGSSSFMAFGPAMYWGFLGGLVSLVTSAILQAAIISGAASDLNGRPVSVGDSLRIGLRAFLPLIGLGILLGIAVGLGFVLLIIPGVLMWLAWCVAVPVYVVEQPGVFASFERSAELTRGNRLRIFALGCVFVVAAIIVEIVGGIVGSILSFATGGLYVYVNAVIVSPLIGALVAVLAATLSAVLYVELRRVREGAGASAMAALFD
jgi:hypothetical protein